MKIHLLKQRCLTKLASNSKKDICFFQDFSAVTTLGFSLLIHPSTKKKAKLESKEIHPQFLSLSLRSWGVFSFNICGGT